MKEGWVDVFAMPSAGGGGGEGAMRDAFGDDHLHWHLLDGPRTSPHNRKCALLGC